MIDGAFLLLRCRSSAPLYLDDLVADRCDIDDRDRFFLVVACRRDTRSQSTVVCLLISTRSTSSSYRLLNVMLNDIAFLPTAAVSHCPVWPIAAIPFGNGVSNVKK